VVRDEAGQPVAGAEVEFFTDMGHERGHVTTDAAGRFRAPGPAAELVRPPERLVVYARRDGRAARKPLPWPAVSELAELTLRPAATLRGQVRDTAGRPLPGARVRLSGPSSSSLLPGRPTLTDGEGRFELQGILYGTGWVLAEADGWAPCSRAVSVAPDSTTIDGLDCPLGRTPSVTGRVVDETGAPIGGVRIEGDRRGRVESEIGERTRHLDWDVTEADGTFRIVYSGRWNRWRFEPQVSGGASLVPAELSIGVGLFYLSRQPRLAVSNPQELKAQRPDEFIEVVLRQGARLSGVVRDAAGRPLAHQLLVVHLPSPGVPQGHTDVDGRFTLGPVPPGVAQIQAFQGPARRRVTLMKLEVRAGQDLRDLNLVLPVAPGPTAVRR
jgi:hypothetical protein